MVKAILVSAALAAASIASVAQAASLKQDPLFGCDFAGATSGPLGLGAPAEDGTISSDTIPAGFVAGRTGKSRITGTSKNSALSTTRPNGDAVSSQDFEFVNCTQSLMDRGYELNVPQSFAALSTDEVTYTYSWGILRSADSEKYSLSPKVAQDSKGRLDGVPLLHTKVASTKPEYRTFIMAQPASDDPDATPIGFLEYYPFAGTADAPKAGQFFAADDKWGSVSVSTNFTKYEGTTFLTLGVIPAPEEETPAST
ncbi:hypothetical protein BCV69DRAFT_298633 [Microstroma glucosiphilum]|uniref:Uncharacterized protein n=1 Tax=Pseudomicrostroma glucosiphilum TaxID=1684307 RepID=A0A316U8Z0_9BASI|nr:hypothetical protein BCV69DRAFT_298633 [Pseudomicrostroma glucosiphilum]PWN21632.1 hypothetical protein BCV69DRAFT_298633 [Pseudomicrostroma glucosiphilum]